MGAIRSAAEKRGMDPACIRSIFGGEGREISKGRAAFNDARLLFYPVRSLDRAYYLASCPSMLADCARLLQICGCEEAARLLQDLSERESNRAYGGRNADALRVMAEDWPVEKAADPRIRDVLNRFVSGESRLIILSDERMNELMESLPVVAWNKLDNGISANLWYEEFVPRGAVFLLGVLDGAPELNDLLTGTADHPIQVGANATVGYGNLKNPG